MSSAPRDAAHWIVPGVAMVAAVLAGYGARDVWGQPASAAATAASAVPVSSTVVVRTDVAQRQVLSGTLGYQGSYPVANPAAPGIVTWLPGTGTVIRRGQLLYRLDDQPSVLFYGPVPAWRDIGPGVTAGPDVRELSANLIALGYGTGAPADSYDWTVQAAVERWQLGHGLRPTGVVPLGQAVFLPGPVRVGQAAVTAGAQVAPGGTVLQCTSTELAADVNLAPGGAPVRAGDGVIVTLPDGITTVPGTIVTIGGVTMVPGSGQSGPSAVLPAVVRLARYPGSLDQVPVQVAITEQEDRGVLAVPVNALLAQPGGGYAVRTPGVPGRLIPVTTGLYDESAGLVEVSGTGLAAGMSVEVAQS